MGMIDIKKNYKNKYKSNTSCRMCYDKDEYNQGLQ